MVEKILLKDGIKYTLWKPENELTQFEPLIKDHIKDIFGNDCEYFPKQKLKTLADIRTIPDGFVIDFKNQEWYIVELKLLCDDAIKRISGQIVDYKNAIENSRTRKQIFESIRDQIDNPPKFLYDLVFNKEPTIVVIINNLDGDEGQQFKEKVHGTEKNAKIIEFKTFERENAPGVYIHQFEPLSRIVPPPTSERKPIIDPEGEPIKADEDQFSKSMKNSIFAKLIEEIPKIDNRIYLKAKQKTMVAFYIREEREKGLVWVDYPSNIWCVTRLLKGDYSKADTQNKVKYSKEGGKTFGGYPIFKVESLEDVQYLIKLLKYALSFQQQKWAV